MSSTSYPTPAPSKLPSASLAEDRPASRIFAQLASVMTTSGLGFRFQAKGHSMLPIVQDGEILYVHPVDPCSIKIGEIVLFRDRDGFKAHRVLQKKQGLFITRGDSSVQADGAVQLDRIIGKVVAKECATTGQVICLQGPWSRLSFFAVVARKGVPASIRKAGRLLISAVKLCALHG